MIKGRKNAPVATRNFIQKLKRRLIKQGKCQCEVCGWDGSGFPDALHVHHILPKSLGGRDTIDNIAVLCPNHHSIVHAIYATQKGTYIGPLTRPDLLNELRLVETDKKLWQQIQDNRHIINGMALIKAIGL